MDLIEQIDAWLQTTVTDRAMFSKAEVQDMLLDLRGKAVTPEPEPEPAPA